MASINIPSSLKTLSQKPVDEKVFKNTLTDLSNYSESDAYGFWSGLEVKIGDTNKTYVWKENNGDTGATPSFTYPQGHIVDGFNYGSKTFSFHEVTGSEPVQTYKTSVYNATHPVISIDMGYPKGLVRETSEETDPGTGEITQKFGLYQITSSTLSIRNDVELPTGDPTELIHIEYYGEGAGNNFAKIIGELPDDNFITNNPGKTVVVVPDDSGNITKGPVPITEGVKIKFPVGGVIVGTGPIFNPKLGETIKVGLPVDKETIVGAPFLKGNLLGGGFEVSGGLIKNISTEQLVSVQNLSSNESSIKFNKTIFDPNETLLDIEGNVDMDLSEVSISSTSSIPVIKSTGAKVKITSSKVSSTNSSKFIEVSDNAELTLDNTTFKGVLNSVVDVKATDINNAPKVLLTNSSIKDLTVQEVFSTTTSANIPDNFVKINNTEVSNGTTISNNITKVRVSNTINETTSGGSSVEIGDVQGLTNALNDKANSSHTHEISDINNLSTTLSGKADNSLSNVSSSLSELDKRSFREKIQGYRFLEVSNNSYTIVPNRLDVTEIFYENTKGSTFNINLSSGDFTGQKIIIHFKYVEAGTTSLMEGDMLVLPTASEPDSAQMVRIDDVNRYKGYEMIWSNSKNLWIVKIME